MNSLSKIKRPVTDELAAFQKVFRNSVKSKVPLLDVIMRYILKAKGKQMRPLIVIYSAKLFNNVNESTYRAATLIELMHTATLVHDDVVDDSTQRRGRFSINALWKNKIAVLVGDYLLSRGLLVALENKEYKILDIVSRAVKEMSEGELLQIEKARKLDIKEDIYYKALIYTLKMCKAIWPGTLPELEAAMKLFSTTMNTMLNFYMKNAESIKDHFKEDRSFKKQMQPEKLYREWADRRDRWERYLDELIIEVVKAANWLADLVRRDINPLFMATDGKFSLNGGLTDNFSSYTIVPEYSTDEKRQLIDSYEQKCINLKTKADSIDV